VTWVYSRPSVYVYILGIIDIYIYINIYVYILGTLVTLCREYLSSDFIQELHWVYWDAEFEYM
jgi:hypothetical protein